MIIFIWKETCFISRGCGFLPFAAAWLDLFHCEFVCFSCALWALEWHAVPSSSSFLGTLRQRSSAPVILTLVTWLSVQFAWCLRCNVTVSPFPQFLLGWWVTRSSPHARWGGVKLRLWEPRVFMYCLEFSCGAGSSPTFVYSVSRFYWFLPIHVYLSWGW